MSNADTKIRECLDQGKSFILDAGAGSGKTYSLVQAIKHLCATKRNELSRAGQRIACITFTNVAKNEIVERTGDASIVRVSTIHDFLWDVVRPHQKALKKALLKFNGDLPEKSSRKKDTSELVDALVKIPIVYSDMGSNFLEGRLHHDDLLGVVRLLFRDNSLASRLVVAKFPYIFVDEYQDTSRAVIDVLLSSILSINPKNVVIGLFGDKMQTIYHGGENPGIGEIPADLSANLVQVLKEDNRRCSLAVIKLLNHIRTDITQIPTGNNVDGSAVYIHLNTNDPKDALISARNFVEKNLGWVLRGESEKELYLTHRLIAKKAGYEELLEVFGRRGGFYRDDLLSGDDPRIAFFLDKIEPLAEAWSAGKTGKTLSQLRENGYKLNSNKGKKLAKEALDKLLVLRKESTVRAVLEHIRDTRLSPLLDEINDRLNATPRVDGDDSTDKEVQEREAKDHEFYEGLFGLHYVQVMSFTTFFNAYTPFATKHGVKGMEFDTVFIVLDDKGAKWNIYSFDKYLSGEDEAKNADRFRRTRNVFYVCCSRAKHNLAVIDLGDRSSTKDQRVKTLFGQDRCFHIDANKMFSD